MLIDCSSDDLQQEIIDERLLMPDYSYEKRNSVSSVGSSDPGLSFSGSSFDAGSDVATTSPNDTSPFFSPQYAPYLASVLFSPQSNERCAKQNQRLISPISTQQAQWPPSAFHSNVSWQGHPEHSPTGTSGLYHDLKEERVYDTYLTQAGQSFDPPANSAPDSFAVGGYLPSPASDWSQSRSMIGESFRETVDPAITTTLRTGMSSATMSPFADFGLSAPQCLNGTKPLPQSFICHKKTRSNARRSKKATRPNKTGQFFGLEAVKKVPKTTDDYKCKICNKSFKRAEHYNRHWNSCHHGEKRFRCALASMIGEPYCDKVVNRRDNLTQHHATHVNGDGKNRNTVVHKDVMLACIDTVGRIDIHEDLSDADRLKTRQGFNKQIDHKEENRRQSTRPRPHIPHEIMERIGIPCSGGCVLREDGSGVYTAACGDKEVAPCKAR